MGFFSFFSKDKKEVLDKGLSKSKESVLGKITRAIAGKSKVDDEVLDNLEEAIAEQLQAVRDGIYEKALNRRNEMTYTATNLEEMKEIADTKPGLVKAMWCGELECEEKIKEEAGLTSRCMPFEQEEIGEVCACCGKPAKKMVYWGKAY